MNAETARLLAQALEMRDTAAAGLVGVFKGPGDQLEVPGPVEGVMTDLATTYVHEQRVINAIISEDTDE